MAPLMLLFVASSLLASAQTRTFTKDDIEYVLEFPSPSWQLVARLDVHDHLEFIYESDPVRGCLNLRKRLVDAGTTADELFRFDQKWELQ